MRKKSVKDKAAVHYTSDELNNLIGQDVVVEFIYNLLNRDEDYIGLKRTITGVLFGDNPLHIPASIYFDPTEQFAFNAEAGNIELPENISILSIRNIRT